MCGEVPLRNPSLMLAAPCRPTESQRQTAVTNIQKVWRGFVARKRVSQMRQQVLLCKHPAAAIAIQSFWRGYAARVKVSQMRQARRAWWRLSRKAQALSLFLAHMRAVTRQAKLSIWNVQQRYASLVACVRLIFSCVIIYCMGCVVPKTESSHERCCIQQLHRSKLTSVPPDSISMSRQGRVCIYRQVLYYSYCIVLGKCE